MAVFFQLRLLQPSALHGGAMPATLHPRREQFGWSTSIGWSTLITEIEAAASSSIGSYHVAMVIPCCGDIQHLRQA
jgi:hypothetical protein